MISTCNSQKDYNLSQVLQYIQILVKNLLKEEIKFLYIFNNINIHNFQYMMNDISKINVYLFILF